MIVDDQMQVVYRSIIISASEIEGRDFIIKNKNPVMINITAVFFQFFVDIFYQCKTLFECAGHQVPVDLRQMNINPGMNAEVIVVLALRRSVILLELFQDHFEFTKMTQIEKAIQHIMHAFDIVTG